MVADRIVREYREDPWFRFFRDIFSHTRSQNQMRFNGHLFGELLAVGLLHSGAALPPPVFWDKGTPGYPDFNDEPRRQINAFAMSQRACFFFSFATADDNPQPGPSDFDSLAVKARQLLVQRFLTVIAANTELERMFLVLLARRPLCRGLTFPPYLRLLASHLYERSKEVEQTTETLTVLLDAMLNWGMGHLVFTPGLIVEERFKQYFTFRGIEPLLTLAKAPPFRDYQGFHENDFSSFNQGAFDARAALGYFRLMHGVTREVL